MNDIIMIMCYFGSIPNYIHYLINSIKKNKLFDFVLITNDTKFILDVHITNFKIIYMSCDELNLLVKNNLDINYDFLNKYYKICDYRPLFGNLFKSIIKSYKYYGHLDIDVILGDMSSCVDNIYSNDIYTFNDGENNLYGPFTIYKNIEYINNLWKNIDGIKEMLENDKSFVIDEKIIINYMAKLKIFKNNNHITGKMARRNIIKYDGKLYLQNNEYHIFHFSKYKNNFNTIVKNKKAFVIKNGFVLE